MARQETNPNQSTRDAERAEGRKDHLADREGTTDENAAADEAESKLSEAERAAVAQHEREMAERGARQKGEGRVE
jgi:hypothetical protein